MNPTIKAKWVAALRSGEYKQTSGRLRDTTGYCCLGVLCDLAAKEGVGAWGQDGHDYFAFHGASCTGIDLPPPEVDRWVDRTDYCVRVDDAKVREALSAAKADVPWPGYTAPGDYDLPWLNDHGVPFNVIADLIEASE